MDKENDKPDRSKKRKHYVDQRESSEVVTKRQRDEANEEGESIDSPFQSIDEGESTPTPMQPIEVDESTTVPVEPIEGDEVPTQPTPKEDTSAPGCSYDWRSQSTEVEAPKVEPESSNMEWRQAKADGEDDANADSGLSYLTDETEQGDDEEECEGASCNLVSRTVYEWEDESWEDEFVLRMSTVTVREPKEPVYGPQPDPLYNPETAIQEGWDWPDPDEDKPIQWDETAEIQDVLLLEDSGVAPEVQGERLMNEGEMEGEKVINPNDDAN